jgi:carboxyl-terminal processing protease
MEEAISKSPKGIVLDLRNNPGGFLEASIDIASYFLPQGTVVLIEELGADVENKIYRSKGYTLLKDINPEIIILQNRGSASASEIIAGALRDNGVASIVGEQSFGKGSVQQLIALSNDTALKVTVAKWLTPKENQISKIGIIPDVEILPDYDSIEDRQLQKTLKLFN